MVNHFHDLDAFHIELETICGEGVANLTLAVREGMTGKCRRLLVLSLPSNILIIYITSVTRFRDKF